MRRRAPSLSALLAAALVAFAGVLALSAGSLSTGCGEGFVDETAGAPPTFVPSPTRVDAGYAFPRPDAAIACTAPQSPVVSGGACVGPGGPPRLLCNPITNAGCLDDATCDFSVSAGLFRCFPPGDAGLCAACSESSKGPACANGSTCRGGLGACTRYCCGDDDCGGGTCVAQPPAPVGICDAIGGDRLATFGVGEHGGAPRPNAVALCDLPTPGPSPGHCVSVDATGEVKCNPVTNEGCTEGSSCDVIPGGFRCLPVRLPPVKPSAGAGGMGGEGGNGGAASGGAGAGGAGNAGAGNGGGGGEAGAAGAPKPIGELCGACDDDDVGGPTCLPGMHCVNGACARFCCWDDDCGGAECDLTFFGTLGVGVCVREEIGGAGGEGGAAGTGGAAGNGGGGAGGGAGMGLAGGQSGAGGKSGAAGAAGFAGAGFGGVAGFAGASGFAGADGLAGVSGSAGAGGGGS